MLRKSLGCCALAAMLAAPAALDAKDGHGKKATNREKDSARRDHYPRQTTRGHQPQDDNGDGVVTRNEWPGDDNSFRALDRNGDGILSNDDRQVDPKENRIHGGQNRRR